LRDRGYARATVDGYLRSVAHFAHWSAGRLQELTDIDEAVVGRFVDGNLPLCQCAPRCVRAKPEVRAALGKLLTLLRMQRLIPEKASTVPLTVAAEVEAFDAYLVEVRGLRAITRQSRLGHVRDFLLSHFGNGNIQVAALAPRDIEGFVRDYTAGWKAASVKQVSISLRSYLRYKAALGIDTSGLAAAAPRVAQWRLSRLPRELSAPQIEQLLGAFDHRTASGRRDYAIARCYVDLGLRTTDIARLELDDLNWREGKLHIDSKSRRTDVLPLPAATGRAIVAYLRSGRPRTSSRALFLRHRPPLDKPATADTIRGTVRNAARRCGLSKQLTGPHILRHTLAHRLVQSGASLKAIADLLRHRSLDTTTIYAKVDLHALGNVAAPWPGRRQ
jgi:site-specific recombinase XerD